jgi:SET domain-containing protein
MSVELIPPSKIYLGESEITNGGRGMFALKDIKMGEQIEVCPVIEVTSHWHKLLIRFTELRNYYFQWGEDRRCIAICLGYGSIYNHSYQPNAEFKKDLINKTITFTALSDIPSGSEILVNYNGDPTSKESLWTKKIPGFKPEN